MKSSRVSSATRWLLASALVLGFTRQAAAQADLATVKSRMLADAVNNAGFKAQTEGYYGTDLTKADSYLSSIGTNGSWSDINYGDKTNEFAPLKHLDRILVLSYAYNKTGNALLKSASALSAINNALAYWYQVNPKAENWFKNDIAKQFYLGPIGLMMQGAIEGAHLTKITNDLTDAPSKTGANKTALSTSVIYRAVIEGNATRLSSGVNGVVGEVKITAGDGIQRDNSFQQHGGILYNGNYGYGFLRDVTWVGAILAGTQYAFASAPISLLKDNYLEGTRWMIRGGVLDYSVRGREPGNGAGAEQRADSFLGILDHFAVIDPANKATYQASRDAISTKLPQGVVGTRHYWNSDYTAAQRPGYFSSVKMCSKRTIGMERNVNTENLLGYWLPYGVTFTYRRGDEYDYIFPVWDWARLPGLTAPHDEISWSDDPTTYTSQTTSFVGGASDGEYGASAMDLSIQQTQAKKSWFWFNREWVALGAGITSSHSQPVYTNVQQSLKKGDVVADGTAFSGAAKALTNPKWVLHDGIGYFFPEDATVQIQASAQTGNVKRIMGLGSATTVSHDVFSLWFDHGKAPSGKSYAYAVVPGLDQAKLDQYSKSKPFTIISNTASVQAVTQNYQRITGGVFFKAGTAAVAAGPSVKVDVPCVVVLNEPAGTVAVSDPSGAARTVNVTVTNVSGTSKSQAVTLPTGDNTGKSVVVTNLLDKRAALDDGLGVSGGTGGAGGAGGTGGGMAGNGGLGGGMAGNGGLGGTTSEGGSSVSGGSSNEGGGTAGTSDAGGTTTAGTSSAAGGNGGSGSGAAPGTGGSSPPSTGGSSTGSGGGSTDGDDGGGCTIALPGGGSSSAAGFGLAFLALGASLLRSRRSRVSGR